MLYLLLTLLALIPTVGWAGSTGISPLSNQSGQVFITSGTNAGDRIYWNGSSWVTGSTGAALSAVSLSGTPLSILLYNPTASLNASTVSVLDQEPTITWTNPGNWYGLVFGGTHTVQGTNPGANFKSSVLITDISKSSTNGIAPWLPDQFYDQELAQLDGSGVTATTAVTNVPSTGSQTRAYTVDHLQQYMASNGANFTMGDTDGHAGIVSQPFYTSCTTTVAGGHTCCSSSCSTTNSVLHIVRHSVVQDLGGIFTLSGGGTISLDNDDTIYAKDKSNSVAGVTFGKIAVVDSKLTSGTGKWFLYDEGGAASSLLGNLRLGDNTAPTHTLELTSSVVGLSVAGTPGTSLQTLDASATLTGIINAVELFPAGLSLGAGSGGFAPGGSVVGITTQKTWTFTAAPGGITALPFLKFVPTITTSSNISPSIFGLNALYVAPTVEGNGSSSTFTISDVSGGFPAFAAVVSNPTFANTNSSTGTATTYAALASSGTDAWSWTTWNAVKYLTPGGTGAITNEVAFDVPSDMTRGGTIIATLRSAVGSGAGKWFLLGTGSAASTLGGSLFVGNTGSVVPAASLHVQQPTTMTELTRFETVESNGGNTRLRRFQDNVQTTGSTATAIGTFTTTSGTAYAVRARVEGRCASGSGCTAGQMLQCDIIAAVKDVGGTTSLVGTATSASCNTDVTGLTCTSACALAVAATPCTGEKFCVKVTGAANQTINWHLDYEVMDGT